MGRLAGRVAIVTGAGRGLGREYALGLAAEGARVVVNDVDAGAESDSRVSSPARDVVAEIRDRGGEAAADHHDIADSPGAEALVGAALREFGDVDVVVNNAGILRDRMLVNMSDAEWDDVVRVHLRGHFCVTRAAAQHWRSVAKANPAQELRSRVLVHTTSISGLFGSPGQANYAAAKSAIATFAQECHLELHERLNVRAYAVGPSARTRLTEGSPAAAHLVARPTDDRFDFFDPANVSPFVVWLATPECSASSGQVFTVEGDEVTLVEPWRRGPCIKAGDIRWTLDALDRAAPELVSRG